MRGHRGLAFSWKALQLTRCRRRSVCPALQPAGGRSGGRFLGAYWRRPESYLSADVRAAISTFSKLRDVEDGLVALRRDLASGEWHNRYGQLLHRSTLDLGYRLVVA